MNLLAFAAPVLAMTVQSAPAPSPSPSPPIPIPPAPVDGAALLAALPVDAQAHFRCGILFAVVAGGQEAGDERALVYPAMEPRGKEFFVRQVAGLMEGETLDRRAIDAMARASARDYVNERDQEVRVNEDKVAAAMPPCLSLLEASGL